MAQINSYLTFKGNCREAMRFYQYCLGGELLFQTVGQSPLSEKMPAAMQNAILHASLSHKQLVLLGSDMVSDQGYQPGNTVSLMLNCSSEEEIRTTYAKLAEGGNATHPPERSFWGALSGDLTDRFGNSWILHYDNSRTIQ